MTTYVVLSRYQVQVDASAAKSSAKNQKALSGGERSFATVCFIMSLWDAIEAPFRVLDEFDVFMVSGYGLLHTYIQHTQARTYVHTALHCVDPTCCAGHGESQDEHEAVAAECRKECRPPVHLPHTTEHEVRELRDS